MHNTAAGIDPNWIIAITGVLTFFTAVVAATYAAKAARRGRDQVDAARQQTAEAHAQAEAAREQVELEKKSFEQQASAATEQHDALLRSERRAIEARVDARMPTVIAVATLPTTRLEVRSEVSAGEFEWQGVDEDMEFPNSAPTPVFQQRVEVAIRNISSVAARVDFADTAAGEIEGVPSGTSLVIAPGGVRKVLWTRVVNGQVLQQQDGAEGDPRHWLFNVRLWVRDLGMDACDAYVFNGDLRYFKRDGSRLLVTSHLFYEWGDGVNVATPVGGRVYDRLDAAETEVEEL